MPKDYLPELLENIQGQLRDVVGTQRSQSKQLNRIENHTSLTNGRVTNLEAAVTKLETVTAAPRLLDRLDNKTLYVIAAIFLVTLIIIAKSVAHVDLTRLFG